MITKSARRHSYWRSTTVLLLSLVCSLAAAQHDLPQANSLRQGAFHVAVFSQDGTRLLTATGPIAQLWDVETGDLIQEYAGHDAAIHNVCFSPDEKRILTGAGNAGVVGANDPTARLWNAENGEILSTFQAPLKFVFFVEFSPDGERVLTVSFDGSRIFGHTAVVWDVDAEERQCSLSGVTYASTTTGKIEPVRFSPRGRTLVGMPESNTPITLWDASTGEIVRQIKVDRANNAAEEVSFGSIEFSADEKLLLAACSDNAARIWDVGTGGEVRVFQHPGSVTAAKFCLGGAAVMTASDDGIARLWETDSGREIRQFRHSGPIREMQVTNDGRRMSTKWYRPKEDRGDLEWSGALWDIETGQELRRFEDTARGVMAFSPDSRMMLAKSSGGDVRLINARTGDTIRVYK